MIRVTLAESIKARSRDVFEVRAPQVPSYASFQASVACIADEFPSPAPPEVDTRELTLTRCRIVRFTDGSVRVSGTARNALAQDIGQASATFKLGKNEFTTTLPVPLKPGDEKGFEFLIPECPTFDDWAFDLAYGDAAKPASVVPSTPTLAARRTESKEIPPDRAISSKPRDKDPLEETTATNKKTGKVFATAELRGLFWLKGKLLKNKQYTGDVAFMKVAFHDGKGKLIQPVGQIEATVQVDGESRTVTRQFRRDSWRAEASKLNAATVTPDFTAFDEEAGDLWVGLIRRDKATAISRADIGISIAGLGTWEWKGLESKCQAPPKAPDKQ